MTAALWIAAAAAVGVVAWLILRRKPAPAPPPQPPTHPPDPPTDPPKPPDPTVRAPFMGYYLVDSPMYGDWWTEVVDWTDAYHAWAWRGYIKDSSQPFTGPDGWMFEMRGKIRRAHDAGKRIVLCLEVGNPNVPPPAALLDLAAPFWDAVELVDLADEPDWTAARADAAAVFVRSLLVERGLAPRPIGITLEYKAQALGSDIVNAKGIDWWGLECYRDPAHQDRPVAQLVEDLKGHVRKMAARVPGKVLLIGQGYARNGAWTNEDTLVALQRPVFDLLVELTPRAMGILWFSYGRPSGTREHPRLLHEHSKIARLMGLKK